MFAALTFFFRGLKYMPLAEGIAVAFSAPLFVTALSYPVLRERVGPIPAGARWCRLLRSTDHICSPVRTRSGSGGSLHRGGALFFALAVLTTRRISVTETNVAMYTYSTIFAGLATSPRAALRLGYLSEASHLGSVPAAGTDRRCRGLSHDRCLPELSGRSERTVRLHIALIWGALMGWIVWNETPGRKCLDRRTLIVVAAGLTITYRETRAGISMPRRGRRFNSLKYLLFFVVVLNHLVQQPDTPAAAPAPVDGGFLGAHGGAGDVQVNPRNIVDEALQELGGGDGAGFAAADVLHVGKVGIDHLVVRLAQRHTPDGFARGFTGSSDSRSLSSSLLENRPACSLPSAMRMAPVSVARSIMNCGLNRSCVYQRASASTSRPSASVFKHLDGLSGHGGDDVARALGLAVRHVFHKADDADGIHLCLSGSKSMHEAGNAGRTAHIALHVAHAGAGFQRDAAGVEGDALADESNGLRALFAAQPLHHGELAFALRTFADAEE